MSIDIAILMVFALMISTVIDKNKPEKPSLQKAVENITYVKDKAGICYASLASDTSGGHEVISITAVPCEKVRL
jgi:microsomal dipeptidase-like Zn-dependent dipeptidase